MCPALSLIFNFVLSVSKSFKMFLELRWHRLDMFELMEQFQSIRTHMTVQPVTIDLRLTRVDEHITSASMPTFGG